MLKMDLTAQHSRSNGVEASLSGMAPSPNDGESLVEKRARRGSLGRVVKELRIEKRISQEKLAKAARMDRTTLARLECGKFKTLSVAKLGGIAAALGIDLKILLTKAETVGESLTFRGNVSRVEFVLDYPGEGFRIVSLLPRRKEFFFGKIEVQPKSTVASATLPHPGQICLHALEGKLILTRKDTEYLLKPGDYFAFNGLDEYEFSNTDQFKTAVALFITYPCFLSL